MTPDSAALRAPVPLPPFWDEMVDGRGSIRPHWRGIVGMLASLPQGGLADRARRLDRAFEEEGVVTILPADPGQGHVQRPWRCDPVPMVLPASEFATLEANRDLLARIAGQTGGEVIELDDLENFVASLPNRKIPIVESWTYPLWHQWKLFLFAAACLIGEWGVRRWNGLP